MTGGSNGFAEAYMDGTWSSPDLPKLLEWFDRNGAALEATTDGPILVRVSDRVRHALRSNTRRNSRRNIAAHYDLGNAFYSAWLDASMSYSSGIYADAQTTLEEAQAAKIARVCALLELQPGDHVLEIGAGWGGVMEAAALRGAAITGLTLSVEQKAFAEAVSPTRHPARHGRCACRTIAMSSAASTALSRSRCWKPSARRTGPFISGKCMTD